MPLAFLYACGLARACLPAKPLFRAVMLLPVLAPSLLPALALVTLFGNQGLLRGLLGGGSLYGPAGIVAAGWGSLLVSVRLAAAVAGTPLVFVTAWLLERGAAGGSLAGVVRFAAGLPLAVPGLVLGLGTILFFNHPANPHGVLYGTLGLLVLNSLVHFYTVPHLAAVTAIRQLDPEFEAVGASLRVPALVTFARVTVPICLPAILDIAVCLFVNAMTTVSAVIFLYGPDTKPASIAVLHMDEAGKASAAAAMACAILGATAAVKLGQLAMAGVVERATQRWRGR